MKDSLFKIKYVDMRGETAFRRIRASCPSAATIQFKQQYRKEYGNYPHVLLCKNVSKQR